MNQTRPITNLLALSSRRPYLFALVAISCAVFFGALGFYLIEGWSILDSLYAATQTVTTVGFGDVVPRTSAGRAFAVMFMLAGTGVVLYALSNVVQAIVQSEILTSLGQRRRVKEMKKLQDHFIICGAGRVGARIIQELQRESVPFIVIETAQPKVLGLIDSGAHVIVGDATLETTLKAAGVDRARGLAACLPNDADNLYVVLTARDLNRSLHIVARAVEEQAEPKLVRAGASRVVAPIIIGSHRMAQALVKPAVADFMDSIAAENLDLGFEQVEIDPKSVYAGKALRDTNIRSELNSIVVVVRRIDGEMIYHPGGGVEIKPNDLLVVIGRPDTLARMVEAAGGR